MSLGAGCFCFLDNCLLTSRYPKSSYSFFVVGAQNLGKACPLIPAPARLWALPASMTIWEIICLV